MNEREKTQKKTKGETSSSSSSDDSSNETEKKKKKKTGFFFYKGFSFYYIDSMQKAVNDVIDIFTSA